MSEKNKLFNDIRLITEKEFSVLEISLSEVFRASAFANRFTLHPRRLEELAKLNIQNFISYLSNHDIEAVSAQGKAMATEGLHQRPLFEIGQTLHRFCAENINAGKSKLLLAAFDIVDTYMRALFDGFVEERERQILNDQEQLRLALSTALEHQRRELYIKNHAIHTSINGIILCDLEGKITYSNPALVDMWGFSSAKQLLGSECSQFWGDEGENILSNLTESGGWQGEINTTKQDGSPLNVAISASMIRDARDVPVGIVSFFYDVSERKQLEAQFRQAQKMEALGQLAGGIVHDFNNLLTAISGYSQLALLELPEESKTYQDFVQIKTATDRGRELTQELRIFTRQGSSKRETLSLNTIVEETYNLLLHTFPPEVKISTNLDPGLRGIKANVSQMSQMLMNLCVNARDAVLSDLAKRDTNGETKQGELTIKTYNVELDWRSASRFLHAQPGHYICLCVQDNGSGIPHDNIDRLFEPFFTTKGEKGGTGLGLAVVYGIVQNHEGFIDVHSREGAGSVLNIYLPVIESKNIEESSQTYTPDLAVGKGTVLVAEDNPQVQAMVRRALEESGYTVLATKDGADAISVFEKRGKDIDLVILDMLMPHIGGRDCFYRLREIDSKVKILLMTGFTANGSIEDFLGEGAIGVITKPFELHTFTEAVHKAISGKKA